MYSLNAFFSAGSITLCYLYHSSSYVSSLGNHTITLVQMHMRKPYLFYYFLECPFNQWIENELTYILTAHLQMCHTCRWTILSVCSLHSVARNQRSNDLLNPWFSYFQRSKTLITVTEDMSVQIFMERKQFAGTIGGYHVPRG